MLNPEMVFSGATPLSKEFIENSMVISTVSKKKKDVLEKCKNAGLEYEKNFIDVQSLCPFTPSIEISGICNLRCLACPRGDTLHPFSKGDFMTIANYEKVINKLMNDIPILYIVSVYIFGEPTLNPNLPEIIRINRSFGVATDISTNLNVNAKTLEEIIKANPEYIRIACSGYGEKNYEVTHAGAKWKLFYENLFKLREFINKYNSSTNIEVYFQANKNNITEYKPMYELCEKLGFRRASVVQMLLTDYVRDYILGNELPPGAKKAKNLMLINIDEMIADCKSEHSKPCIFRKSIPVINWDMSVLTCCNQRYEKIADNFLDISFEKIIELRNNSDFCKTCVKYSLHRYFSAGPNGKYQDYLNQLFMDTVKVPFYV